MSSSAHRPGYWILAWWPVVFGCLIIAIESTEWLGADQTGRILRPIWQAIFGPVSDTRWDVIHHYIRKCGHFVGYGALGLCWLRAWRRTLTRFGLRTHALLALLAVAIIAASDEFHQSFLSNRTSSLWDVLLDCTGACVLILLSWVFFRSTRRERVAHAV